MNKNSENYWKRIFKSVLTGLILVLIIFTWIGWGYIIRFEGVTKFILTYFLPLWVVITLTIFIVPSLFRLLYRSSNETFFRQLLKSFFVALILALILLFIFLSLDGWKVYLREELADFSVAFINGLAPLWLYFSFVTTICTLFFRYSYKASLKKKQGISPVADLTRFKDLEPRLGVEILDQAKKIDGKVEYSVALEALKRANISEWYAKRMLEHRGAYIAVAKIRVMLRDPEEALPGGKMLLETSMMQCPRCESFNIEVMQENRSYFSIGKAVVGRAFAGKIGTLVGFAGTSQGFDSFCKDCRHRFIITR